MIVPREIKEKMGRVKAVVEWLSFCNAHITKTETFTTHTETDLLFFYLYMLFIYVHCPFHPMYFFAFITGEKNQTNWQYFTVLFVFVTCNNLECRSLLYGQTHHRHGTKIEFSFVCFD